MPNNSSTNSGKHPYLRIERWVHGTATEPPLIFWHTPNHTKETQERLDNWLQEWRAKERYYDNKLNQ